MYTKYGLIILLFLLILISKLNAQDLENKSKAKNILIITSKPKVTKVYIDSVYVGPTPLQLYDLKLGKHKIVFMENNEILEESFFIYNGGKKEIYPILDGDYCLVDFLTYPDSAEISINDSLYGSTPLLDIELLLGVHKIEIKKQDYVEISQQFFFSRRKYTYFRKLEYKYGFVNLPPNDDLLKITIDGEEKPLQQLKDYKLLTGKHLFKVEMKNYHKSISKELNIKPASMNQLNVFYNYFSTENIYRSALIPGLGQISDKSIIKGSAFFIGFTTSLVLFIDAVNVYYSNLNKFNNSKKAYLMADSEDEAIYLRYKMEESLKVVNNSIDKKNVALCLLIGVYTLNVIDAYIFHTKGSRIEFITKLDTQPLKPNYQVGLKIKF